MKKQFLVISCLLTTSLMFSMTNDSTFGDSNDYVDITSVGDLVKAPVEKEPEELSYVQQTINSNITEIQNAIKKQNTITNKYDLFVNMLLDASITTVEALQKRAADIRNIQIAITGTSDNQDFNLEHITEIIHATFAFKTYQASIDPQVKANKSLGADKAYKARLAVKECWKSFSKIKNVGRFLRKLFNRMTAADCTVFVQQAQSGDDFLKALEYSITKTKGFTLVEIQTFNRAKEVSLREITSKMTIEELKSFKEQGQLLDDLSLAIVNKRISTLKNSSQEQKPLNPADTARKPKSQPADEMHGERAAGK